MTATLTEPVAAGVSPVEDFTLRLYRDVDFDWSLAQFDDDTGDPLDYDPDDPPRIVFPYLTSPVTWTATVDQNQATWAQPWTDDAELIPRGARAELWITSADSPIAAGEVVLGGVRG